MKSVFFLFLLITLTGCNFQKKSEPLGATELQKYQICQTDRDCVYTQNGPCDCNNGGQATAINKSNLSEFQSLFKQRVPCHLRGGHRCEDGVASCENRRCTWKVNAPKFSNSDPNPMAPPPPPPPSDQ